ncbi:MAG: hypothetical protein KF764_11815 [Labilithrix sp.]|nr:hypothetical protein [Labilithrix sp.]MBX3216583.1 hypothetical protein [Labilithrix sp.]
MVSPRTACVLFASLAALTVGCRSPGDLASSSRAALAAIPGKAAPAEVAQPGPGRATPVAVPTEVAPAEATPRSAPMFAAAPSGEQTIDTQVGPTYEPSTAPVLTTHDLKRSKVRTVSDERLPKWVPVRGRLTVVDSSDLAENLGLVPKGATKKSDERISVADKLAEESAARAASDPMTQGSSWGYAKAGRFRSRR